MTNRRNTTANAASFGGDIHTADGSAYANKRISRLRQARGRGTKYAQLGISKSEVGAALEEWQTVTGFVVAFARRRLAHRNIEFFNKGSFVPTLRQSVSSRIHEREFEKRLGHRLQRFVHSPIQFDLVV